MSIATQATDHLSTGDRWAHYNDPRRWADAGIWHRPSFNVHRFQKKVNRLIGTSDGKPIVRLQWAWDVKRFEAGEIRQAYRFYTATLPNGDTCDLSPPRWMMEERFEPQQYMPNWEDVRYVRVPAGHRFKGWDDDWWEWTAAGWKKRDEPLKRPIFEPHYDVVDALGPPPRDGMYSYLYTIADHDPDWSCCKRAFRDWKKGKRKTMRCWGYYREPGQADLDRLQQAKVARDATPFKQSPFEPLTAETLADIAVIERAWNEEQDKNRKEHITGMWGNHEAIWGHRVETTDPGVLANGKYHFMPEKSFGQTESGLIVPTE